MVPRLLLCANPAASGFTGGLHREVVARLRRAFDVETTWPNSPAETRSVTAAAAGDGVEVVVAMGGDGVVHHVANGVGGTAAALGIIPAGTTNVFGRLIGIPSNPKKAADFICRDPTARPIPTAMLTLDHGEAGMENRLTTFSTGVGFDADVVQVAEQEPFRKYWFGGVHYARTAASVVWKDYAHRPPLLEVTAGGRSAKAVAVLVQLHQKYTYFGRVALTLGPWSPGTATVLVAHSLARRRVGRILFGAVSGRPLANIEGIEVWEGITSLDVTIGDATIPAQADGELLGSPRRITVETRPDYLRVIAPPPVS